jgi:hydroxymethylbilane synthase
VGSASDGRVVRAQAEGTADAPDALGQAVAAELLALGAGEFL